MKRLVFSDTKYFYKTFQTLIYSVEFMQIITDFKSVTEMPEHARKLFRIISSTTGFRPGFGRKTGRTLDKRYQVSIEHDRFNRICLRIKFTPVPEIQTI